MIKIFATDMDGTFLNSENDYNRKRFADLFKQMQAKGIRFVAISGNQYYQIKSFFKGYEDKITIVGENGAYLVENDVFIGSHRLPLDLVRTVLDYLKEKALDQELVLCGEKSAYLLRTTSQQVKDFFAIYYHELVEVDSFETLPDDHFLKFSFNTPIEVTKDVVHVLNQRLGDTIQAVSSGHGNIDIIAKGIHKGSAMTYLLKRWDLSPNQLAAFGDGGNDIEMLKLTPHSYAMANGSDEVKSIARHRAPSNDQEGVLATMAQLIDEN